MNLDWNEEIVIEITRSSAAIEADDGAGAIVIRGQQRPGKPDIPRTILVVRPKPMPNPAISGNERR